VTGLINCTLTNNSARGGSSLSDGQGGSGYGGALFNLDGQVSLTNDTLASNSVASGTGNASNQADGGAVYNLAYGNNIDTGSPVTDSLILNNNILAKSSGGNDLSSALVNGAGINTTTISGTHNLVMTCSVLINPGVITLTADPNLGPLQNNGGLTSTMLPLSGSPVLGAGVAFAAPTSDQRGVPRPTNGPTDLGSVQVSGVPTSPPPSPPGGGGQTRTPPGLVQAVLSLFLDGARIETANLDAAFFDNEESLAGANTSVLDSLVAALFVPDLGVVQADIAFNLPYAGPFGPIAELAGAAAVFNAVFGPS
jgi:hypothetical protein